MNGGFYVTDDDITTKKQFVAALRKFIHTGKTAALPDNGREYRTSPGEVELLHAIAEYFEAHDEIPDKDLGINFFDDLRKHLADTFHEFRTHTKHETLRQIYKGQTDGDEIPDLFDARSQRARQRVVYNLGRLMPLIAGRMGGTWLEPALTGYFDAEIHVVEAAWRVFVRECYRMIAPKIKASSARSHKALYGRTWLSIDTMAGRSQYTFERMASEPDVRILDKLTAIAENRDASPENKYAAIEALLMTRTPQPPTLGRYEISFAADESDMLGTRSGMNYPGSRITDFRACVDMIEDVVAHWDPERLV